MRTLSSSSNLWGYEDWWQLREKLIVQMIVILIKRHCLLLGPLSVSPISLEKHFDIWLSSHLNASKSPFLQSCQDLPRFTKHHASCQIITLAPDRQKQRTLSPISPYKTKLIVCIDQSGLHVQIAKTAWSHSVRNLWFPRPDGAIVWRCWRPSWARICNV